MGIKMLISFWRKVWGTKEDKERVKRQWKRITDLVGGNVQAIAWIFFILLVFVAFPLIAVIRLAG